MTSEARAPWYLRAGAWIGTGPGALATGGGVAALLAPTELWIAGAVVAYAAVFAVRVADFTWDVERDRDVM